MLLQGLGILLILAVTGWNIPSLLNGKTVNWSIAAGMEEEARELVEKYKDKPLLDRPDNEEYFQGRYGLRPGKTRYTSRRGKNGRVSPEDIRERLVLLYVEEYAKTHYIEEGR